MVMAKLFNLKPFIQQMACGSDVGFKIGCGVPAFFFFFGRFLCPFHSSTHQASKHGHDHLGFNLHKVVGQGVHTSADLPGH